MLQEFSEEEIEQLLVQGYIIDPNDGIAKRNSYDGLWDKVYKEDGVITHMGKERINGNKQEFRRELKRIEDINNG